MAKVSCKMVADRLGVSYVVASGLVAHLVKAGKAVVVDKVFHESGKGKPTRFYEIEDNVSLDLSGVGVVEVVEPVVEVVEGVVEVVEGVGVDVDVDVDVSEAA